MKRLSVLLGCLCLLLTSCSNKSEEEIRQEIESGVILIQNSSYYEVKFSNGETIYFKGIDEDGDIEGFATHCDSVEKNVSYGTGFFISSDGQIATNAHVISDMMTEKALNKSMNRFKDALKTLIEAAYEEKFETLKRVQQAYEYARSSYEVSYDDFYEIKDYRDALKQELNEYVELYNELDNFRPEDADIQYQNEVSIAYNNSFVTKPEDFISCVVIKTDKEHDLGIIQLKNKQTPEGKYVFEVPQEDPLETYSLGEKITAKISDDKNSKLLMIGYNLGPTLALTQEGIKSQFNIGVVSQKTSERIMYSIPTLPGSSGSPVVNQCGQLVAVNYAGINSTQSFNYGVRIKYLQHLLEQ